MNEPIQPAASGDGQSVQAPSDTNTAPSAEAAAFKAWIMEDLKGGKMTPEQADAALKEIGQQGLNDIPVDARTEMEKQFDDSFPVAKPHEIQWPYTPEEAITPQY